MKCDRPFQLNIHNILKVNPKCANSGHFKLTIDGLLRAITQTMEVGWGDWRLCAGSAGLAVADQWYHHYHKAQYLNVIIVIPIWIRGWPVASVWQAASPHRPASKHRRLQIISAAEIQLAYLSISVWNRRYGGPMSDVTTIFLQLKVTLWFLCLFIVMSNVGERCSSMLHYWEEDNAGGAMRSVRWINTDHNCKVQAPQPLMLYGI